MSKPDDIPQDVWDAAWGVEAWARPHYSRGTAETAKIKVVEAIARAIMAAKAEQREADAALAEEADSWVSRFELAAAIRATP